MGYSPHVWTTGETITAMKLNNIENAIEGNSIDIENTADKNFNEAIKNGCADILAQLPGVSETKGGVKFEWSGDTCHVSAASQVSSTVQNNFFKSLTSFPLGVQKGVTYRVFFHSEKISCRVYEAVNGSQYGNMLISTRSSPNGELSFMFSEDAEGCVISLGVNPSDTPLDETITKPRILNTLTNKELELRTDSLANSVSGVSQRINYLTDISKGKIFTTLSHDNEFGRAFALNDGAHGVAVEEFSGRTIVLNQMANNAQESSSGHGGSGVTFTRNRDGSITANRSSTDSSSSSYYISDVNYNLIAGHKYLLTGCPSGGSQNTYRIFANASQAFGAVGNEYGNGIILTATSTRTLSNEAIYIQINGAYMATNLVFRPQMIDLTLMFGADLAETISSAAQAYAAGCPRWTADSAEIPRNTGELKSTCVNRISTTATMGGEERSMEIVNISMMFSLLMDTVTEYLNLKMVFLKVIYITILDTMLIEQSGYFVDV